MASGSDQKVERRNSSGSLPPSLPPTPPSPAFPPSKTADRATHSLLSPHSSLPPVNSTSESTVRALSPATPTLPRSRSSSRVFDSDKTTSNGVDDEEGASSIHEDKTKANYGVKTGTKLNPPSVPDPIREIIMADSPPLPTPKPPSSCPIFCCFYAEFDIVVGPKVAFQSPRGFMDQDTGVSAHDIYEMLEETFQRVCTDKENNGSARSVVDTTTDDGGGSENASRKAVPDDGSQDGLLSIFDATSEYIITGNELAGKMINLSTHNMHILTRPTAITDERYERNALLFSVGFVLSRQEDPRPFRPLLCRFADILRSMEVESHFLTDPALRCKLQSMLDRLLVSLNSEKWECNLLLDPANALNLRAFRPPKPPASPVPDHAVPLLVREDLFNLYDWDLAIKWVSMFISGVDHARWIASKSIVDMEMVRACLRVLKHHGVIALVDMFFYTNRYEFTERASAMLAGKEPKLLQEAMEYVSHLHQRSNTNTPPLGETSPGLAIANLSTSLGRHSDMPFLPISEDIMSFPPRKNSGSGLQIGSTPSTREVSKSTTSKRQQAKRMKSALAELYCACNRNTSFGELMVEKVEKSSDTPRRSNKQMSSSEDHSIEFDDIHESLGKDKVVRLSSVSDSERSVSRSKNTLPVLESSTSFERTRKTAQRDGVDWKEVFKSFDHRRFATFGVVHGLLRRVHNFPSAVDTTSYDPSSVEEPSIASRIAAMMDGTKCDDELVCEFEKPIDELIELVEASGRKVMSIYV